MKRKRNIICCYISVAPSSYDLVMLAASRFESTPLGQLLSHIERTHVQQVIRCYVIDFVHMAHPGKSESEHRVSCLFFLLLD